ncbi:MAG: immunoglobulin domain-containing protein [Luteolibacter sp.]
MKASIILPCLLAGFLFTTAHAVEVANAAADYLTAPDGSATTAPTAEPDGWDYLVSDASTGGIELALTPNQDSGNAGNTGFAGGDTSFILGSQTGGAQFEIYTDGFDGSGTTAKQSATGNEGVVGTDLLMTPGSVATKTNVIARYTLTSADLENGSNATISGSFRNLVVRNTPNANSQGSVDVFVYHNTTQLFIVDQDDPAAIPCALEQSLGTFNITGLSVAEGDTISFVVGNNGVTARDETALQASIDLSPPAVDQPPLVTINPVSQDLFIGDTLNLSVSVSGTPPFSYEWRKDGSPIPGEINATFNISPVDLADAGDFNCVVMNDFGSDTSAVATVTVSEVPPTITTQPISQTLIVGEPLNLSVVADGTAPFTYEWSKDFEVISPAETNDTFTIESVTLEDSGEYYVQVFNAAGDIYSDLATILVRTNDAPISSSPDVATNENVTLTLNVDDLATDGDADPLTITGAAATSVGGATIQFNGSRVGYFPIPNSTITDDTFTVDVSDGLATTTVTVSVDVVAVSSTVVGDPALDYVDSTTLPTNWTYLRSTASTGGTENLLEASIAIGNAGNTGFGHAAGNFAVSAVLGNIDGGTEYEVFSDGQEGHRGLPGADLLLSPGDGDAENSTVIARYTFEGADITSFGSTATVSGSFRDLQGNTGGGGAGSVIVSIFLNGTQLWTATGADGRLFEVDGTFNLSGGFTVTAGDELSFVVNNNGNFGGDETALRAAISLSMDTPAATGFAAYISGYSGLSDATAGGDPDSDGIVNLMEYVLNGNPGTSDTEILPSGTRVGTDLIFFFVRRSESPNDTTQVLQISEDLVSFTDVPLDSGTPPAGVTIELGTPSGGLQSVFVTISDNLTPNGNGFVRLKVTQP